MDTNLLVYAAMPATDEHDATRTWLQARYEDPTELVGLCWPTLYAFVRLASSRRVMGADASPLGAAWTAAMAFVEQDNARLIDAGPVHASIAAELLASPGLSSDDVPDVQLAALAIEHGLTLCTHDHGFARFGRLGWIDPLS
ncbi:MAG: TA system VapC family ribonuclease toxin [Egibacteraceae bacterium]